MTTTIDATSELGVGGLFAFSDFERSLVLVIVMEYDKQAKSARKQLLNLNLAVMSVDTARSRAALVIDAVTQAAQGEAITLAAPLRTLLGDACSLHARKLKKRESDLTEMLVDVDDVQSAYNATQFIANRIGEQLVLFLPTEDEE